MPRERWLYCNCPNHLPGQDRLVSRSTYTKDLSLPIQDFVEHEPEQEELGEHCEPSLGTE